ncbi:MAG: hypothetical protein Q8M05_04395 [Rhodoferax sp.]|uniref:hypothetical protein n=1 Tax=Rhodoferax sp. TaxID=50421 RepID=UPI002731ADC4|nr:hypothetical protein [Rhodoferax sp.]MDP1528601.1 hypothetical protein [Rhodoferax sp.]
MTEGTNHAVEAIKSLNDIGFAEFTSDLITKTFDAIIDANLRQTESYIDLVKEMTKTLQTYINDTKLEISNQEVLGYLASLPPLTTSAGEPIGNEAASGTNKPPLALTEGETVAPANLNAINQQFTVPSMVTEIIKIAKASGGVSGLLKDATGLVKGLVPAANHTAVFPVENAPDYYSPDAFQSLLGPNPPDPVKITDVAVAKLYDSVAEVIAGDKYALLQEMVKLGVIRLVVTGGVMKSSLTFSTWERSSQSSSNYEKHKELEVSKSRFRTAPSFGLLAMLRARPIEKNRTKQRDLRVQTSSQYASSSQGTNITVTGGVEIHFRTDYLPVAQA